MTKQIATILIFVRLCALSILKVLLTNPEGYLFRLKRQFSIVKRIPKQINKFNLTNSDLNFTADLLLNYYKYVSLNK